MFVNPPTTNLVFPTDKINPDYSYKTTPLNFSPSELPSQELLNSTSASRFRADFRFSATIPPYEIPIFATDPLQTWPSQSQSPRHLPPTSSTDHFANENPDFVLFPSTAPSTRPQTTQARRNSELAQATSRTVPSPNLRLINFAQQNRKNSAQQSQASSASPIQNPRVSGIIHGSGSPSTSPSMQYSPKIGQQTHFYANSAPSSTVGLHQQSPRKRPPVPLFSNSTGSIPQANMAHSITHEGSSFSETGSQVSDLTSSSDDMFDFKQFPSAPDANNDGLFDSCLNFSNHFEPVNDMAQFQASPAQTISPKDLMVDSMSAPPSGAFTDLTTPGTSILESPYMTNSSDPSPLFTDNLSFDEDPNKWVPLFGEVEEPAKNAPLVESHSSPMTSPMAQKMSRNDSSPGKSSTPSSHQGRHSFAAGVAPKRKDKPLPAIHVDDPNDMVAVKRARNTLAARKSREKRVERTEFLVSRVTELEAEAEHWKSIALSMGYTE